MKNNEIKILENKTLLAAWYYLEEDELSFSKHESIKGELRRSISRSDIALFNEQNILARGEMEADKNITIDKLNSIRKNKQLSFTTKEYFYNGIFYEDNEGDFVVVTRELKKGFEHQINTLLRILIIVFVVGVLMIYLFSQFLGRFAYAPILQIMDQIKDRDNVNFYEPIRVEKSYSEIEELVHTYNHFIERLGHTFLVQKNFIDYVSHELRTPMTALMGTIDVSQNKTRSTQEYQETIALLKQYVNDLEETLDKMMLLSGAKTTFEFEEVRIDEIIWKVIENAILYFQAEIDVSIEVRYPALLKIEGNADLLEMAFNNIVENAVKYSDNDEVKVVIKSVDRTLVIEIIDQGVGVSQSDLKHITQNFYRGENAEAFQGKGIGLSMAQVVFALHQMKLFIYSEDVGTRVQIVVENQ